ncbi:aminoacyl-tRNA deacylase [Aliivibrio fischeri]|uniref:Regulatory protein n=1 Tax=Aliivibrio fischeri SR5 TaxID=1088719 RepID=A0AAV3EUP6_ALIFS|nr:YbaK/EbsC family protein [Aliivibrio fischeri]EHN70506.1 regulatory protein [Aliivibrio fischeri SR5]
MMSKLQTAVTDLLDKKQIPYRLLPHKTPAISVQDAAEQRGVSPSQMVKTIVLRDMGGRLALACVPGDQQVDPKKVRQLLDCRRMTCVSSDEVKLITGFEIGTINPIVTATPMPVFLDIHFQQHQYINISSGDRMAGIELTLSDLCHLCQPTLASLCRELD